MRPGLKEGIDRPLYSVIIYRMSEPEGTRHRTINDELLIDIYANPILKTLVIVIDRPFEQELTGLELNRSDRNLLFIFGEEKRDLGDPLRENLLPFFEGRNEIEIYQMDMETKKPVNAIKVPLTITGQAEA